MLGNLQELGSIIYLLLPRSFRKFILPVGEPIYQIIKRILQFVFGTRQAAFLLKGKNKWGKGDLTLLFYGDEKELAYFSDLLYSERSTKEKLGKVFIWNLKTLLNSEITGPNMIICAVDILFLNFLTRQGFIIIPQWVQFLIDLSKPLSEIWYLSKNQKKSLANDLRKIPKYQYSYEISHNPADFKLFYYEMYRPYALIRYENTLILNSYNHMKLIFDKGFLLFIKRRNEYVGGNLIYIDKRIPTIHSLGVKEGNFKYVQQGALAALYYFTIHWAKEQGYKWIDFYFARPFLKDGVFHYKRKLGMEIKRSKKSRTVFGMKIGSLNRGVKDFFANNPFIYLDRGKLKGLTFIGHNRPFTPRDLQTFYISGIDTLVVISPVAITNQAYKFVGSQSMDKPFLMHVDPKLFFEDPTNIIED